MRSLLKDQLCISYAFVDFNILLLVFPPTSDAKRLDFHEDRDPKHFGMGTARVKTGKTKVSGPCEAPTNPAEDSNVVDKLKNNLATGKLCPDSVSSEVPRASTGDELDKEKANDKDPTTVESSFKSVASIEVSIFVTDYYE